MSKDLVSKKKEIKCNHIIKQYKKWLTLMMLHNWPQILGHPYKILIIRASGSGKTNSLLNLINQQPDIDKIYLFAKGPYEEKYQYLKVQT